MDMRQRRVRIVRNTLHRMAQELDPAEVDVGEATVLLEDMVAVKNLAATLEGRLARRLADAREWERAGFPSAEAWLARRTGSALGKAKESLDTAERLETLPEVAAAANVSSIREPSSMTWGPSSTSFGSFPGSVPGFAVAKYRDRLRDLHEAMQRDGGFETTASRMLVEATKPT